MTDKIQDKIRKLLAMSRDAGASENEQAQALKHAQRLMLKHGINHIDEKGKVDWGKVMEDFKKKPYQLLAQAVGRLYGTKPIFAHDFKTFRFVGRKEIREVAEMTTHYIADQLDLAYRTNLPKGMTKSERSSWRREFKLSCAYRVASRIDLMIKEITSNDKIAQAELGCKSVVVLNHTKELEMEIGDFLKTFKITKSRKSTTKFHNANAARAGQKAGDKVRINQQIKKNMPKQLT